MFHNKHQFKFGDNKAKMLDIESQYYRRLISEMVHIYAQDNPINLLSDIKKLQSIYDSHHSPSSLTTFKIISFLLIDL